MIKIRHFRGIQVSGVRPEQGAGYWLLVAGYWMLDARCSMLDAGCSMLDARCSMLDAGFSILVTGNSVMVSGVRFRVSGLRVAGHWKLATWFSMLDTWGVWQVKWSVPSVAVLCFPSSVLRHLSSDLKIGFVFSNYIWHKGTEVQRHKVGAAIWRIFAFCFENSEFWTLDSFEMLEYQILKIKKQNDISKCKDEVVYSGQILI